MKADDELTDLDGAYNDDFKPEQATLGERMVVIIFILYALFCFLVAGPVMIWRWFVK